MAENKDGLNTEDDVLRYEDTPVTDPVNENKKIADKLDKKVEDLTAQEVVREESPVGVPHWQALLDLHRILPCQVLPANTTLWKNAVDVVKDDNSDQLVVITEDGERLYEREIRTPILVRTTDPEANLLH